MQSYKIHGIVVTRSHDTIQSYKIHGIVVIRSHDTNKQRIVYCCDRKRKVDLEDTSFFTDKVITCEKCNRYLIG